MEPAMRSKGRGLWHCIPSCSLGYQSSRLCMEAAPQCEGGGGLSWRWKGPASGKDNRVPQRLSYCDRVEERISQGLVSTVPRKCPGTWIPYNLPFLELDPGPKHEL